jgi:hypothetical protein
MFKHVLPPATIRKMIAELSQEEAKELLEHVLAATPPEGSSRLSEAIAFVTEASEWLIQWRARKHGGIG